jgi:DNA-binding SARP family transcriptional activator
MASEWRLSVFVLGPARIAFAGRNLKVRNRKSLAVVACIALTENLRETRERLIGLLWGEFPQENAQNSLNQALTELRRVFNEAGFRCFQTARLAVGFDPASIEVDLASVISEAEARRVHPLLLNTPRLPDCLLEGFDDLDPEFEIWLRVKRRMLDDRLLRTLGEGLRDEAVDARTRVRMAEAIINLDRTKEEAYRCLMRSKAEEGDINGAVRLYQRLCQHLAEDGLEPSAETQRLIEDIVDPDRRVTPPPILPIDDAS